MATNTSNQAGAATGQGGQGDDEDITEPVRPLEGGMSRIGNVGEVMGDIQRGWGVQGGQKSFSAQGDGRLISLWVNPLRGEL